MIPVILHRDLPEDELQACYKYFGFPNTFSSRSLVLSNDLVIPRYSSLPFYRELENDVKLKGARLINSYDQHQFCADIHEWYRIFENYTPKMYDSVWSELPKDKFFVLKGKTNSRKHNWNTKMFAKGRSEVVEVARRLYDDEFIAEQGLAVREYVPLVTFAEGINGLPITEEYRCFFYKHNLLATGFYWGNYEEFSKPIPQDGLKFAKSMGSKAGDFSNFYCIDIARTQSGEWIVIELNCGTMSGLGLIDPETFYMALKANVVADAMRDALSLAKIRD